MMRQVIQCHNFVPAGQELCPKPHVVWDTVVVLRAAIEFGFAPPWDTVLGTQPSLHQFDFEVSRY